MKPMLLSLFSLVLALCAGAREPERVSGEISVAAAADLRFVMEELARGFRESHPEAQVKPTFGASGTLFAQITHGGAFDLYLSADMSFPMRLVEAGLADGQVFPYAQGTVVLWSRNESGVGDLSPQGLLAAGVRRIAIANPVTAPYGRSGKASLETLGLWEKVKDKIVQAENVAQAAQFAESGNAEVGIISLSLAVSEQMKGKGRWEALPGDSYPPLAQGGVVVKGGKNPVGARAFVEFLTSEQGRGILERRGFEGTTRPSDR